MLAGNAQSGAVFHQPDIVNIGHFGTADALVNPAHHITQNTLRIIVELLLHIVGRPLRMAFHRHGQNRIKRGARAVLQLVLNRIDIDLMIVNGVQSGCRWGRGPSTIRPGFRLADFLLNHIGHHIGHRPHAFADLRATLKTAGQTDIDIPIFIGIEPAAGFHIGFTDHRTHFHGSMNLVARAIEKAGIDENHPRFGGADTFFQIHRGAAFFIHNSHFET